MHDEAELCLHQLFERHVRDDPHASAVTSTEGRVTRGELDQRADRLARTLIQRGVGPDVLVGVCLSRSIEQVVAILGILKAGGAFLPLDPEYPKERLRFMRDDARPLLVLEQAEEAEGLAEKPASAVAPDHLAYVIYTSGSTGRPKGIALCHRGVVNNICDLNERFGVGANDRVLSVSALGFDMTVYEILGTLAAGATLVIPDPKRVHEPAHLAELVRAHQITIWNSAPALLDALVEHETVADQGRLRSLRLALLGGDWVPLGLQPALRALAPTCRFIAMGGATEASIHSTLFEVETVDPGWRSVPYGRAMKNQETYVLGPDGHAVEAGEAGELYLGGMGIARGYWRHPELTAERFLPNPFRPGERFYRTGDRVRLLADGNLELLGRIDHQIKIRGVRIEPAEVEAALTADPRVRRALATVKNGQLVAYVVVEGDRDVLTRELRARLLQSLPATFVPDAIVFLDRFPLSPNGKLDRSALPAPERTRTSRHTDYVAPRSPLESEIAELCRQLLDCDAIGRDDDLFELGAHSLTQVQLVSRLRARFDVEIPLRELVAAFSVSEIARRVEEHQASPVRALPSIPRRSPTAARPASFAQERLWFLEQLAGAGPYAYNEVLTVRLHGNVDVKALEESLSLLIRRHAALRTSFSLVEGTLRQDVTEACDVPLLVRDLGELAPDEREERLGLLARAEAMRPFDLARGPLLRATVVQLGTEEQVLVFAMHHSVNDGWSNGIFVRELSAVLEGRTLPELTLEYTDYAAWQRDFFDVATLSSRLDSIRERLDGAPTLLALPWDRPRPREASFRGARVPIALGPRVSARARELSIRESTSLYVTLLAAFQALLGRLTGQEDFLLGSVSANRGRSELERVIGFFVNTLVLRTDLSGRPDFRELCRRARRSALHALEMEDTPFEAVVARLAPERDLGKNPLFQALFVLHNTPALPDRFALLENALEAPDQPVASLSLLGAREIETLESFDGPPLPTPITRPIHELFQEVAGRVPEAIALRYGNRQLTYRELEARANQLARRLQSLGVGPERRVAVYLERSFELIITLLAILKSGGAYLPIDPTTPPARLAFLLEDSAPAALVTVGWLAESLPHFPGQRVLLDIDADEIARQSAEPPTERTAWPDNLAYLIYTSGSSGQPKAVMVEHQSLANYLTWCIDSYRVADGIGAPVQSSPAFDLTVTSLFAPLLVGKSVVLLPEDPGAFAHALRAESGYSLIKLTPAQLDLLSESLSALEARGIANLLVIGGEALHGKSLEFFRTHAPETRLVNEYGPTESVVGCSAYELAKDEPLPDAVPIGRPIANARLYILDPALTRVPIGVIGELYVGGIGVSRGYFQRPRLTAERFLPDPFAEKPGARLYKTGDLARYRSDGIIEFVGREDSQVKVRGYRVELGEIEAKLRAHPDVREAIVIQEPTGSRRLLAYVAPSARPTTDALLELLKEDLPSYMLPSVIERVEALPRTPAGKVDKRRLPAIESSPPTRARTEAVAPRNPVEALLANTLGELLGLTALGVHDDFFEQGGDSLLAIRGIARIRDYFHLDFTLREFLAAPTVAGVAAELAKASDDRARLERTAQLVLEVTGLTEVEAERRLRELEPSS
jgi:amino acid adenylation domain-containing protein